MRKFCLSMVLLAAFLVICPAAYAASWVLIGDDADGEVQYYLDKDSIVRQGDLLQVATEIKLIKPEKYNNITMIDSQMEFKVADRQERTVRQVQYDAAGKLYVTELGEEKNWKPIKAGTLAEGVLNTALSIKGK